MPAARELFLDLLNEWSLARAERKYGRSDKGFAILSAWPRDRSPEDNAKANQKLLSALWSLYPRVVLKFLHGIASNDDMTELLREPTYWVSGASLAEILGLTQQF